MNIMNDDETRNYFVEELCDVLMYFNDVMLCYSISPEELKEVYYIFPFSITIPLGNL